MVLDFLPWTHSLIVNFSYLGIFLISLLSSATIFLPLPFYGFVLFASVLGLNPWITAIATAGGDTIGELTGYLVGKGGKSVMEEKHRHKIIKLFMRFFKKYGFATNMVVAFIPFPFNVMGILSGIGNYGVKKFLLATFIGKTAKFMLIAYLSYVVGLHLLQLWRGI